MGDGLALAVDLADGRTGGATGIVDRTAGVEMEGRLRDGVLHDHVRPVMFHSQKRV